MAEHDFKRLAADPKFKELLKNSFIFPISIFFILATLLFPVLTGYTNILNNIAFWNISWAWIYALLLFIMVWTLVTLYMRKAKSFDKDAEELLKAYRGAKLMNVIVVVMFLIFVGITLFITYFASKRTQSANDFYTAGGGLTGWQNGLAIAGDYLSAASFLGIAGAIALWGFDGFFYWLFNSLSYCVIHRS